MRCTDSVQKCSFVQIVKSRFAFTQWTDMMSEFAKTGTSTVVLPSNFNEASSMFDQILAAGKVTERKGSEE